MGTYLLLSRSSRQTAIRDPYSFPSTDNEQYSDAGSLQIRKSKKKILNNINTPQTHTRPPPQRKDTFVFPRNTDDRMSEVSITRARGRTFRVTTHGYSSDGKTNTNQNQNNKISKNSKAKRNSTDETVSLKDSELMSAREAVEGRKRSASASMIRDKMRERLNNNNNNKQEKLLSKRSNMLVADSNRESKPTWNNNFTAKKKGRLSSLQNLFNSKGTEPANGGAL